MTCIIRQDQIIARRAYCVEPSNFRCVFVRPSVRPSTLFWVTFGPRKKSNLLAMDVFGVLWHGPERNISSPMPKIIDFRKWSVYRSNSNTILRHTIGPSGDLALHVQSSFLFFSGPSRFQSIRSFKIRKPETTKNHELQRVSILKTRPKSIFRSWPEV